MSSSVVDRMDGRLNGVDLRLGVARLLDQPVDAELRRRRDDRAGALGIFREDRFLRVAECGLRTVDGHRKRLGEAEIDGVRDSPGHHEPEPDPRWCVDAGDEGDDAGRCQGRCLQGALRLVRHESCDRLGHGVSGAQAVVRVRSAAGNGSRRRQSPGRALRRGCAPGRAHIERCNRA